jgi:aspartyl protease family protein
VKITLVIYTLFISVCLTGCSGCSKSGRQNRIKNNTVRTSVRENTNADRADNVIQMRKENGVYLVPIKINGVAMEFIFDTGASSISISQAEAIILYKQGKLNPDDFIGKQNFMDANGDISEGTIVNLKTVEVGSKTLYNVRASIVENIQAPLLLGQSALSQFGKISIDYEKEEIKFE